MSTFDLKLRSYEQDDSFKRFLMISLGVHLILAFGFTLKSLILPSETLIIQNAIRVDMVALPDKAEPEVGPSPQPEAAKPVAPAKETPKAPTPEKAKPKEAKKPDPKKAQLDALNKLKQREAMERLMNKQESAPAAKPSTAAAPKKNLNAGNQISQGDSVTGLERIAFDEYISQVKGVVNSNFALPSWLQDSNFKATVEVVIDSSGRITGRTLVKPSGNATFDNAALAAVDSSNPFPPAPDRLTRGWGSFTIQFNFPDNL